MDHKLAIVIPAYKHQFLRKTLESIASQTCKDFNLYIGDDASPNPIGEIVEEFRGRLDFTYQRFEENMGSKSLVGHWKRCIEMKQGEEWIWLFTDDDFMSPGCVMSFYETIKKDPEAGLVRFNKVHVDGCGKILFEIINRLPKIFFNDFLNEVLEFKRASVTLPEFIFNSNLYQKFGLVDFPLAWGADKASFLQFASALPYVSNVTEKIQFNESEFNISSIETKQVLDRKILATSKYFRWLYGFIWKQSYYTKKEKELIFENYLDKQVCVYLNKKYNRRQKVLILCSLIPYSKKLKSKKSLLKLVFY